MNFVESLNYTASFCAYMEREFDVYFYEETTENGVHVYGEFLTYNGYPYILSLHVQSRHTDVYILNSEEQVLYTLSTRKPLLEETKLIQKITRLYAQ